MKIPEYSEYDLIKVDGLFKIIKTSSGKEISITSPKKGKEYVKLKNDLGLWKSVSLSKIIALCYPPAPPEGFTLVPGYTKTFVSKNGETWIGPGETTPLGTLSRPRYYENDYPQVCVERETKNNGSRYVHILLALAYLDKDYLDKGLCVMHLDDNKANFCLSNLKIGTYSENNKAAYDTGVNPSKKL